MTTATIIVNAIIAIIVTASAVCDVPYIVRTKNRIASYGIEPSVLFAVAIHVAVVFASVNIGAALLGQLYGFVMLPAVIAAVLIYDRFDDAYEAGEHVWWFD